MAIGIWLDPIFTAVVGSWLISTGNGRQLATAVAVTTSSQSLPAYRQTPIAKSQPK